MAFKSMDYIIMGRSLAVARDSMLKAGNKEGAEARNLL